MSQFNHIIPLKDNGGFIALDNKAFSNLVSQGSSTEYVDGKALRTRTFVFVYEDDNDENIVIETR